LHEACPQQPLQRPIKRPRPEPHGALGTRCHTLHDCVAVQLPVREREQDVERCGRQRQVCLGRPAGPPFRDHGSLPDISMLDIVINLTPPGAPRQPRGANPTSAAFPPVVARTACPNHGCRWSLGRSAVAAAPYILSNVATTSPIVPSGAIQPPSMSGKSSLQLSHFFPLANLMGHQKLSTLRSISAPREYTPVIQSQYRHQIRSCPTRPLNFWRVTFTQSAWRYRGRPTSGVRMG